jgi:hypothetical protein
MAPDDPRRLGRGNSVLVFGGGHRLQVTPRNGRAGHGSASEQADSGPYGGYQFWSDSDLGLLRETPPGSLWFDRWHPPDPERQEPGLWLHLRDFNPFAASMSRIELDVARKIIDGGDLFAPTRPSG